MPDLEAEAGTEAGFDHDPERERIRAILEACRDDPALFNEAVLGRSLWSKQVEICDSVARYPTTVVPAGRAVGKSFLLAGIVLWWLYTRPHSLVITTGPDHRQVVTVLWKEIRRALRPKYDRVTRERISPLVDLGYAKLTKGMGSPQRLEVIEGGEWGALGFACATEEGFSGQHAENLLCIVDEASGVKDPIWTSIHGLAAVRQLIVGNPIRYDCHFRELWELSATSATISGIQIDSEESPDADKPVSKVGMASRTWLDQMAEIHGRNSPWWLSNIKGQFPSKQSASFIPPAWLDGCTDRRILDDELWRELPDGPTWIGVDPAGGVGADRSVVVVRNGKRILEIFACRWTGLLDDARHRLEPVVIELARKHGVPGYQVVYDKNGPGRSLGSYLAAQGLEGAIGYFGKGKGGVYYVDKRTANAFAFKQRLDPYREGHFPFYIDPEMPEWSALRRELAEIRTPLMAFESGTVKQKLEDKADLMARLHCSPDLSDALLMTFTFE